MRKFTQSLISDRFGLVKLPYQLISKDPSKVDFKTIVSSNCNELRLQPVQSIITRKIGIVVGFSEVAKVTERCEKIEQLFLQDLQFERRDVLDYRYLIRKNIIKLIDDLKNVIKDPYQDSDLDQYLLFFYFAAHWDGPDTIVNQHLSEYTNVTMRLTQIGNQFPNCFVLCLMDSELKITQH